MINFSFIPTDKFQLAITAQEAERYVSSALEYATHDE
jgi:hypothetical protein